MVSWNDDNLREFALCYERHPKSVRTVPGVCPAGCDSASADSADPLKCPESTIGQAPLFADAPQKLTPSSAETTLCGRPNNTKTAPTSHLLYNSRNKMRVHLDALCRHFCLYLT